MRVSARASVALLGVLVTAALALGGCSSVALAHHTPTHTPTAARLPVTSHGVRVIPNIEYTEAGGRPLLLDACLLPADKPSTSDAPDPAPQASILLVHGGG